MRAFTALSCTGIREQMEAPMGRGRNKAKQQKVAREIKYMQREPDFEALSRELRENVAERPDTRVRDLQPAEEDR